MTDEQICFVKQCIKDDDVHRFYNSKKHWIPVRDYVLKKLDRNECQKCKHVYHRYRKATLVHHINHLRDHPELALEVYDSSGRRNLISLCQSCHEEEHIEERHRYTQNKNKFKNEELW